MKKDLSDTPFRHSDFVIPSSLDIRHSFEHVAPTERESLVDDEAINIALLTELQLMEALELYGAYHR